MNSVFIVGNITGDIYYDHLMFKGQETPYLRLVLISSRPRPLRGLRVVLQGELAAQTFPYLRKGSQVAVTGLLQSRIYRERTIIEVEATRLILLHNIDWENGEAVRQRNGWLPLATSANHLYVTGKVSGDIFFDWFERSPEKGGGKYAFLRLILNGGEYLEDLRVVARGSLAELAHPYLQAGSRIAVTGHLQTRQRETGQRVTEVTAEHIAFLENVNWQAGEAARIAHSDPNQFAAGVFGQEFQDEA